MHHPLVGSHVDATGQVLTRFTVTHTAKGRRELMRRPAKAGVAEVAIERGDGPAVYTLLEAGLTVVVISPSQPKNLRSRFGSAGNKDDRFDAFVLADTLRADRARLRPLQPDSPATLTLRATVRARRDLVAHRVAPCNQLRAFLQIAFPGTVGLFADLDGQIAERLALHADAQIFTSLPCSGTVRAARLLAEIGDCRARFPAPTALACLAGAAPSTRRSGKHKSVGFRWAVNKQLRDATRIPARAWLYVIWHCWQDGALYDPTQHRALQQLLTQDQPVAA